MPGYLPKRKICFNGYTHLHNFPKFIPVDLLTYLKCKTFYKLKFK